jgi:hypothetical protein
MRRLVQTLRVALYASFVSKLAIGLIAAVGAVLMIRRLGTYGIPFLHELWIANVLTSLFEVGLPLAYLLILNWIWSLYRAYDQERAAHRASATYAVHNRTGVRIIEILLVLACVASAGDNAVLLAQRFAFMLRDANNSFGDYISTTARYAAGFLEIAYIAAPAVILELLARIQAARSLSDMS